MTSNADPLKGDEDDTQDEVLVRRRKVRRRSVVGRVDQGGHYATKYATKELDGDYELVGRWRRIEGMPSRG